MIISLYSIYDRVAGVFNAPFAAINDSVAVRMFKTACTSEHSEYFAYAQDLDLFKLGSLDQKTGDVQISDKPEFLYRIGVDNE